MPSLKLIIIILSLYGVATTVTFITYIIKYHNLQNKCGLDNLNESNNIRSEPNPSLNNSDNSLKKCEDNLKLCKKHNAEHHLNETDYDNIISKYDIYYDTDFYNKFDLLDEFNDKIVIYSKDMKQCYKECDTNVNCYGFSKYNNYCYLKNKYNLSEKNNASKVTLILNPTKN